MGILNETEAVCAEVALIIREQVEVELNEVEQALVDAELLTRDDVVAARLTA
jgi:hypothetical protein